MILYFLGTGAGVPSKQRNVSSTALKFLDNGNIWLFDCGEATQHQILHTSLKISKIDKIFITHLHGDHIYGLPGLLGSRSFQGATTPLTVYGPCGLKDYIEVSLDVSKTYLRYPLEIKEIIDGELLFDEEYSVTTRKLDHGISSYGYKIMERDKPGSLNVVSLKQIGISPGPIYAKLKQGETVKLDDGRIIHGEHYIGPPKTGRIVTILGDTRLTASASELAKDADLLIHEATFEAEMEQEAYEFYHSTSKQAASVALNANVKTLILTHISSRYQDNGEKLLNEAKAIFNNTLLAKDLFKFELKKIQ